MDIPITVRIIGDRAFYQSGMEEPPMTSPDPPKKESVYRGPTSKPSGIPKPEPAVGTVPRPTPVSKPAPTPTPMPKPGPSPAPAPKPSSESTSAYKPKSKSDSILTKGDLLVFRLVTSIFPLICIAMLLSTFGSFIGAGFCVAPALGILLRVSDNLSAFSCFIDLILAMCGIFLGFAFSVFHILMILCIIDGIALYMLHRFAGKLGSD